MSENSPVKKQNTRDEAALLPPVDVVEDASGITLYADLPGVPRDKLQLQVEAGTLTIEGEIDLAMPGGIESSHAEVSQGVLKLTIPKAEHAQPRKIDVKVL